MSELAEILRSRIRSEGALPFAEFMRMALYHPTLGYYERESSQIGRAGDFFTSVSVGPCFGELLAINFASRLEILAPHRLQIIEAGAHDGQLAHDILLALRHTQPALLERLEYCILEPSVRRREWQREKLREFSTRVRWLAGVEELPPAHVSGVILTNEFLDALPVHRLGWDADSSAWFEWHVRDEGDGFSWLKPTHAGRLALLPPALDAELAGILGPELESQLPEVLPDGYTLEICPAATAWWRRAAECLRDGLLVTFDYGFSRQEAFRPERSTGTLRAYSNHKLAADPLAEPGSQDLTAHVHFTSLVEAGVAAGLRTEFFGTQAQFLGRIVADSPALATDPAWWTPARRRQFQTLSHPGNLGGAFKALAQSRRTR